MSEMAGGNERGAASRGVILRTDALDKAFGGNIAVANVSILVHSGSLHCIIGPNGAGKTTLFNLLTKDLEPTSGEIYFGEQNVTRLAPHQISRLGIGRSYQITSVFAELSVYDNVWVAAFRRHTGTGRYDFWSRPRKYGEVAEQTQATLERVGIAHFAQRQASHLSYGDQRLLEIAVTLAADPRLLLLDEPMSGLSGEETRTVSRLIRDLVPTYTVVMIDHKMDVVMAIGEMITVMNFGKVIAEGSPARIQADKEVQQAYLGG